jgi:UDP-N-acetylglucosamine acyltransferase
LYHQGIGDHECRYRRRWRHHQGWESLLFHELQRSHVGHDCIVGNDVVFATSATLGGHCEIGDFVFMGSLSAAHQFVRIGPETVISATSCVRGDVIPFGLASGQYAGLAGLNIAAMKRREFTSARLGAIRAFYRTLFHGPGVFSERLLGVRYLAGKDPAIAEILAFIDAERHRSPCLPLKNGPPKSR